MKKTTFLTTLTASLLFLISVPFILSSCTSECTHDYLTSTVVAPTCGSEGYTLNTCTSCKSEFKTNYKLPTGHTLSATVFSPTCEKEGYTYYSCACGYSYTSETLPPSGHSYTEKVTEATCSTSGYTEYLCVVCEHTYKSDFVSATEHDMKATVYSPTRTSAGYTEYTCNTCGDSYKDNFIFFSDILGGGYIETSEVVAKGIDVSKWQHTVVSENVYKPLDWNAIKAAGIDFAILRAGYRGYETKTINKDPVFDMNYEGAKAAGINVGAYFYSVATNEQELDEEVDALLGWLEGKQFEYPIYFDIEHSSLEDATQKENLTRLCMRFVTRMRENGYYGAVYANQNWLNNYLYREALEGFCDIWYAHYITGDASVTVGDIFVWDTEEFGAQLAVWQYTDSGIIENCGVSSTATVDMNYSYKDYPSIMKKYGLNGYTDNSDAQG
ncbi:MAG: hypothetical protein IJ011_04435 [Clostridia bacterium]|nr:hypothetical protein [Clostridia bacterium]